MLVQHEVGLALPIDVVEQALIDRLEAIEGMGEVVYREGEELRSKVGPETQLAKEVAITFGQPRISRSGLAIPVSWRATGARSLFPRLDGELEATRTGADQVSLSIRASYDPPLGWVGDALDRLLLERVARMTIEKWLDRVAESLQSAADLTYTE